MGEFYVRATNDGHVEIEISGKITKFSAQDTARFAATLLDCASYGGDPKAAPVTGGQIEWFYVRPTTVTLGSSPHSGYEALVLGFGGAFLGVSLPAQHLKQLGESMIALSASGRGT